MLKAFAGGRLFGAVTGSGQPWVLALHGWRRTHADFAATLAGLDALAVDLPGFGNSPEPDSGWGAAGYAEAVLPLLDELAPHPVIVGHSFGGRVAVHLAAAHPDRVGALVLTGVPLLRRGEHARKKPPLGFRVGRALHGRGLVNDERMEALRRKYGSADYAAASGVMRQVNVRAVNESYEDQLRAIRCPVELVWGDDDTAATLAVAKEAAELLAGERNLTVLPGAGHLTPLTAPDALRDAILRHRP